VTFANNAIAVAVFEKNLLSGGGTATVSNSIFSQSDLSDVSDDAHSELIVRYSISDRELINGQGNTKAAPLFTAPLSYDFTLQYGSPAFDTGDPNAPLDPDGTRTDRGANYIYSLTDYSFHPPRSVIINEVLAHSRDSDPDWIELYNRSDREINIGGWFLSDNPDNPSKFRIPPDTFIPSKGYLVFYEDQHFGKRSTDPGSLYAFALSENGESVILHRPSTNLHLDYIEQQSFEASATGVSIGRTNEQGPSQFTALNAPTPGYQNTSERVGPIVISEVMYHPTPDGQSEHIELLNITTSPVVLFDEDSKLPWRFTKGIVHEFPSNPPLVLAPGERLVLTRDIDSFPAHYSVSNNLRVIQWNSGSLDNKGEKLLLSLPGDFDENGVQHYIAVDGFTYDDQLPWPLSPDGYGASLIRRIETASGIQSTNWIESTPAPGKPSIPQHASFANWERNFDLTNDQSGPMNDPDADGLVNLLEYSFQLSPLEANSVPQLQIDRRDNQLLITSPWFNPAIDLIISLEQTTNVTSIDWSPLLATNIEDLGGLRQLSATIPLDQLKTFIRMAVNQRNQD
jgi:hypothetical protein